MRYLVCIPDGAADEPLASLGGRTPLEAAAMPNLARLAARGEVGRAATIPAGLPPGSDVGNMSILGYDPARYHTGRAPIEAAAMGVDIKPGEVAFRCNLVTVDGAGTMVDFSAGHIPSELSHPIIEAVDAELGGGRDGISFHPGVMYRHVMVAPAALAEADCAPPHDLIGQPATPPSGRAAKALIEIMEASRAVVAAKAAELGASATQVWLWGQGTRPALPA
ncbi:MAG TPA: phosphoglycerate mutase, partial [Acidimicrobiia bacterium]